MTINITAQRMIKSLENDFPVIRIAPPRYSKMTSANLYDLRLHIMIGAVRNDKKPGVLPKGTGYSRINRD